MKRGNILTETRNQKSLDIDKKSVKEILDIINQEDQTIPFIVKENINSIENAVQIVINSFKNKGSLFYIGAGTSGRLGVLDASECPPTFSVNPDLVQGIIAGGLGALVKSAEGKEDLEEEGIKDLKERNITDKDVICGIAAGGSTPYVLGALKYANELGAKTLFLSCNPKSESYIEVDQHIILPVGPEVVTGSTRMKAGTVTKLVLNMITTTAMIKTGKVYSNLMVDLQASNNKLVDRGTRIIETITDLDYEHAKSFLEKANGNVKVAITMYLKQTDFITAKNLLDKNENDLRKVIEND